MCASFTGGDHHKGRDLISCVHCLDANVQGGAQNLAVLTGVCGMEDGHTDSQRAAHMEETV